MATAKEKKEDVKIHLKELRADLRTMHLAVTEELKLPEASEVKDLMIKMESLLKVVDTKTTRKKKAT